ncbi:MAG: DEAD/DEAH box helicase [Gemmatimonadota bacterium]
MNPTFAGLGIARALVEALTALGYEEPTPIQREAIPPLLAGRDLLGQAATGTGKTAAFALPLLQRLPAGPPPSTRPAVLVLVPTRELAMQVAEAFHRYGRSLGARTVPIYGGQAFDQQIRALRRGVHVVIATPGRALDHLRRGTLDLSGVTAIVLDEADEMLDMGFAEDLEAILSAAPAERQTALFSATLPPRIVKIGERHLTNPVRVVLAREKATAGKLPKVRQTAYVVPRAQKIAALGRVLDLEAPTLALVFCRTRTEVDSLAEALGGRGYQAEALHGGMSQEQRDRVMKKTRSGAVDLLIATDVAARGLDIEQLSHVVNFNVPESPDAYVHRIGRTGRAGREGVAITLAEPREHRMLKSIEQATKQKIEIAQLPTVHDVRTKRLDLTKASLRESVMAVDLDAYRTVAESLAEEFDVMDVAAAAVRLAHLAGAGGGATGDEEESLAPEAPSPGYRRTAGRDAERTAALPGQRETTGMARIYIGAGRKNNMRPADIVGAIVNEAGIDAGMIGVIEIADRFSLVELPDELVTPVVAALRAASIKGKRLTVRRDQAKHRSH